MLALTLVLTLGSVVLGKVPTTLVDLTIRSLSLLWVTATFASQLVAGHSVTVALWNTKLGQNSICQFPSRPPN